MQELTSIIALGIITISITVPIAIIAILKTLNFKD